MIPALEEITAAANHRLSAIEAEVARRRLLADPVVWAQEKLGDYLWSAQKKIIESVRDNRRTAVQSCHEIGKSYIASVIAGWWLDINPPGEAFVVTSAPTGAQVRTILWREIGRVHARGRLKGRVNQTEWLMTMPEGNEEIVAFGRKPDEYDPAAFQGIHARKVLYIFDEANGIRGPLFEAADSLIANDEGKALLISNPDDPQGEFYDACKPGSGWNVIEIGAFDTPNFTNEPAPDYLKRMLIGKIYVEEKRKKWAPGWVWSDDGSRCYPAPGFETQETNPLWQSKILGKFPEVAEGGGLIPISWIKAAQMRSLEAFGLNELGVDVGGGGDSSCIAHRHGPVVRIIREDKNPDTMETCGNIVTALERLRSSTVKIDEIGIGRGVVNRGTELNKPFIGINVGSGARNPAAFMNLRAELWWQVRERFESGEIDIDPNDDDLAAELCALRYNRTSSGKIQIESKDQAKKRGVSSPNRADSLMLAFASPEKKIIRKATWGRIKK